jgi:hypothetical protein
MTWIRWFLKRYAEDARLRFFLGFGLAVSLLVFGVNRWG